MVVVYGEEVGVELVDIFLFVYLVIVVVVE